MHRVSVSAYIDVTKDNQSNQILLPLSHTYVQGKAFSQSRPYSLATVAIPQALSYCTVTISESIAVFRNECVVVTG